MIDDPDIFRAAKLLLDQHGEDAAVRAARRADELLEECDVDGAVVYRARQLQTDINTDGSHCYQRRRNKAIF